MIELEKPLLRHLNPLGHELVLWHNSLGLLRSWLSKGRFPAGLAEFLQRWMPPQAPDPLPDEFEVWLGVDHFGAFHLDQTSLAFASHPVWPMLLQLPVLRSQWAASLRASHLEHLLTLLPGAWPVDPMPVPPGAVITGLHIPAWHDWAILRDSGRSFVLRRPHEMSYERSLDAGVPEGGWQAAIEEALRNAQSVLVERRPAVKRWRARYLKDEKGVHLQDAGPA